MNIDIFGTKLIFEIKKGYIDSGCEDKYDDLWCHAKIQVKNRYFDYSISDEMFTNAEIEYLYQMIGKLLNDELKEKENISFIEPYVTFTLYPKSDIRTQKNVIYVKKGYKMQNIYVEFEIDVVDDKLCHGQQSYKIKFERNHIIKFYKYLKKVLCE